MIDKKAQTGIELMVIFGFVLFFFITFFTIIQFNIGEKNLEKERLIAQNIALDVQNEINLAAGASEGYSREFKIPGNILGKDYGIRIVGGSVYVNISGRVGVSYSIVNVTGEVNIPDNIIRKKGGVVYLN